MRGVLIAYGLANYSTVELTFLIAATLISVTAIGWLADATLGDGAFGIVLNAIVLLIGVIIGALLWRKFGFSRGSNADLATFAAAASSALALLLACVATKRWT